jgi:hypothetical protein
MLDIIGSGVYYCPNAEHTRFKKKTPFTWPYHAFGSVDFKEIAASRKAERQ